MASAKIVTPTNVMKTTLADILEETVRKYSRNKAIVFGDEEITYEKLLDNVNVLAAGLRKIGVKREDYANAAILMTNRPEWLYSEFALAKLGVPVVPVNTRYKAQEVEYILKKSDASTLIISENFKNIDFASMIYELCPELYRSEPGELRSARFPALKRVIVLGRNKYSGCFAFNHIMGVGRDTVRAEGPKTLRARINPKDVVLIQFTSGTTGKPKGAMLTHQAVIRQTYVMARELGINEKDRILHHVPFFHITGCVIVTLMSVISGACMVISEYFQPYESLRLIEKGKCTISIGVPTMYLMMLEDKDFAKFDTSCLRAGLIGGSPCPPKLVHDIIENMGVKGLISVYGLTETSASNVATKIGDSPEVIACTVGRPLPGNKVKIINPETGRRLPLGEQGEICLGGRMITKGYYNDPEETTKLIDRDGWLHTKDLGIIDENGNLRITDRITDMFICGGVNVYPAEIENVLSRHPKVKNVYIFGVPDYRLGEVGMAAIECKEGEFCTSEEIIDFCKGKMANYKIPKYVEFSSDFPMTASGKVKKLDLRKMMLTRTQS